MNAKCLEISHKLEADIENGVYGESGKAFVTTRALAEQFQISLEYSNSIMKELARKKVIALFGKHYYLTYKKASCDSDFFEHYKKEKKLGMIISDLNNLFVSRLAQDVADEVAGTGYLLSFMLQNDTERISESFMRERVSGIFVDPFIAKNNPLALKRMPIPVISLGYDLSGFGIDSITVDNFRAGEAIAEHLFKIGCKDFAYIGFVRNDKTDERLNGFKTTLKRNGFLLQDDKTILLNRDAFGKYNTDELFSEIKRLVWKTSSFNKIGIFCYHDLLAYDVISAIKGMDSALLDRKISKDIAIVGFDNLFITSAISPNLTTVSYDTKEMAKKAVASLLDAAVNPRHKEQKQLVGFSIIERQTTS